MADFAFSSSDLRFCVAVPNANPELTAPAIAAIHPPPPPPSPPSEFENS